MGLLDRFRDVREMLDPEYEAPRTAVATNGNGKHAVKAAPAPSEQKSLLTYPAHLFFDIADRGWDGGLAHEVRALSAYRLSWLAYACMSFRATKLVEAPLWIADEGDDGEEWLEGDHPLAELLEQPNPDMEMDELLETISLYLDSTGRCLLLKNRDRGNRVASLYPYHGDEFTVEPADGRLYGRFRVLTDKGQKDYGPDDVVFIRHTDPESPLTGVAPLSAALAHLGISQQMRDAIRSSLRRAIRPGAIISFPQSLDKDERVRFSAEAGSAFAGYQNNGKFVVLEGGATFTQERGGLEDLGTGPVQLDVEAAVCACFKVHPILIGSKLGVENAGGFADSIRPATESFYDLAMFPLWNRIERAFTRQLLREVDSNPLRFIRFDKSRIRALAADMSKRTQEAATAAAFWTVNEQRVHTGQQPLDDDDPRGEELGAPARMPLDLSFLNQSPTREETDEEEDDPPKLRIVKSTKARRANRRALWAVLDAVTRASQSWIEVLAKGEIETDKREILARLEGRTKAHSIGPIPPDEAERIRASIDEYLKSESPERWRIKLRPVIEAVARQAVERSAATVGIDFGLLQPGLEAFIEREVAFLIKSVSETTRDGVRAAIKTGMAEGDTLTALAERVAQAGEFSPARARLIALTESTRAANGATVDTMKQYATDTGLTVKKTWLSAGDSRVREEHRPPLDGETVDIDKPFSNGLMYPSEPNCRCSVTTEVAV